MVPNGLAGPLEEEEDVEDDHDEMNSVLGGGERFQESWDERFVYH